MNRSTLQPPLFFLSLCILAAFALIPNAHASSNNIDITKVPELLGEKLGIGTFAAGILVSSIIICIPTVVIGMLSGKSKNAWIGELIITFSLTCVFIAIGWYPVWILGIICLIVSFAFAEKLARVIIRG